MASLEERIRSLEGQVHALNLIASLGVPLDRHVKCSAPKDYEPLYNYDLDHVESNGVPVGRCRTFLQRAVPLQTLAWLAIQKDSTTLFDSHPATLIDSILRTRINANQVLADPLVKLSHFNAVLPRHYSCKKAAAESLLFLWSSGLECYYPRYELSVET